MMKKQNILLTQSHKVPENTNTGTIPDGYSPVAIIVAIAILIGALSKLIQVLVPVMMKHKD